MLEFYLHTTLRSSVTAFCVKCLQTDRNTHFSLAAAPALAIVKQPVL